MADSDKTGRIGLDPEDGWLTGQFLIAMPTMSDPRFTHALIYICSHGPNGAMGLIVNRLFAEADFAMLLDQLDVRATGEVPQIPVHFGGPVEPGRGFVLHSSDYLHEGTMRIDENVCLTATVEILQAIVDGVGPERALMALGYTGWGAGQLEDEMKANGWLTSAPDETIMFGSVLETKWEQSLAKIGVAPFMLSGEAGHA